MTPQRLQIGPLEILLAGGDIRYLRAGDREVLRRIYVAVRDATWATIPGRIDDLHVHQHATGFEIAYQCTHQHNDIDFAWRAKIVGTLLDDHHAELSFAMEGVSASTFRTNRTGFCVLHPAACSGAPVRIGHASGASEASQFPTLIAPHQPFVDVRTMAWSAGEGIDAELLYEGDIFETEDQRNWTDGSYKTYCRPLAREFPYQIGEGERIEQRVTLRVSWERLVSPGSPTLHVGKAIGKLPQIGVRAGEADWSQAQTQQLGELALSHLRVDVRPSDLTTLRRAARQAQAIGAKLEIALHLPEGAPVDLSSFPRGLPVARCIVHRDRAKVPAESDVRAARAQLRSLGYDQPIGPGSVGNFTEMNRNRPGEDSDLVSYPINPQVHASDDLSLMENLQGQAPTVHTAKAFAPDAWVAVSSVHLHHRPDPFAAGKTGAEKAPPTDEPRHRESFCAAWATISLKRLAEAGADSVTYFQAAGALGLIDDFAEPYPVAAVFRAIAERPGAELLKVRSSDPLRFDALALRSGPLLRMIIANLDYEPVTLTLIRLGTERELKIAPHAIVVVDTEEQ